MRSIPRIQLQINLHAITDTIIRQAQLIMKRPLPLPLQHDLMHRSSNLRRNHRLQHLNGIRGQTRDLSLSAQAVVDGDDDHGLASGGDRRGGGLLFARLAWLALAVAVSSVAAPVGMSIVAAAVVSAVFALVVAAAVIASAI